jgi:hypothetical protein
MVYIVPEDEALGPIGPFPDRGTARSFWWANVSSWTGASFVDLSHATSPEDWLAVMESETDGDRR